MKFAVNNKNLRIDVSHSGEKAFCPIKAVKHFRKAIHNLDVVLKYMAKIKLLLLSQRN